MHAFPSIWNSHICSGGPVAWVAVTPAASLALYLALPAQTIGSPLLCLHRSTTCCAASAIHRPCGCAPSRARLRPHQGTIFTGSGCSWCGGGSQTLPGPPVPVPRPSPRSPVYPPVSVPPAPSVPSWLVQNIDLSLANPRCRFAQSRWTTWCTASLL